MKQKAIEQKLLKLRRLLIFFDYATMSSSLCCLLFSTARITTRHDFGSIGGVNLCSLWNCCLVFCH